MKNKTPPHFTFYLGQAMLDKFNAYCEENSLNKSALLRSLIQREMNSKAPNQPTGISNGVSLTYPTTPLEKEENE